MPTWREVTLILKTRANLIPLPRRTYTKGPHAYIHLYGFTEKFYRLSTKQEIVELRLALNQQHALTN